MTNSDAAALVAAGNAIVAGHSGCGIAPMLERRRKQRKCCAVAVALH
jgi:hypothetical protein